MIEAQSIFQMAINITSWRGQQEVASNFYCTEAASARLYHAPLFSPLQSERRLRSLASRVLRSSTPQEPLSGPISAAGHGNRQAEGKLLPLWLSMPIPSVQAEVREP